MRRGRARERRQRGNIAPERGRLDFDIDMSQLDAAKIERETNALITRAVDTETVWITDEELDIVDRDDNHITRTFSRTLAARLGAELERALR